MPRQARNTEVDAYVFIKDNLRLLGWDTKNPERVESGQVWTQNECLSNPEMRSCLVLDKPENIVKVTERVLWVIEAKREHSQLQEAVNEAEGYAKKLNGSNQFQAKFVSGVAGNFLDSFLIRTEFYDGEKFVPVKLNSVEVSGLLTPLQTAQILHSGNPNIENPIIDEKLFLSRAARINEILHLGAVNPHQRAGVMAALLLSMISDTGPNIEGTSPVVLINDINGRCTGRAS